MIVTNIEFPFQLHPKRERKKKQNGKQNCNGNYDDIVVGGVCGATAGVCEAVHAGVPESERSQHCQLRAGMPRLLQPNLGTQPRPRRRHYVIMM